MAHNVRIVDVNDKILVRRFDSFKRTQVCKYIIFFPIMRIFLILLVLGPVIS